MSLAPFANFADHGDEAATDWRQAIFDLGRHHAIILSRDQSTSGERLELAAEHTRSDFGRPLGAAKQTGFEFAVALRPVLQIPQDPQLVLAADHLLKRADRAAMQAFLRGVRHRRSCSSVRTPL